MWGGMGQLHPRARPLVQEGGLRVTPTMDNSVHHAVDEKGLCSSNLLVWLSRSWYFSTQPSELQHFMLSRLPLEKS